MLFLWLLRHFLSFILSHILAMPCILYFLHFAFYIFLHFAFFLNLNIYFVKCNILLLFFMVIASFLVCYFVTYFGNVFISCLMYLIVYISLSIKVLSSYKLRSSFGTAKASHTLKSAGSRWVRPSVVTSSLPATLTPPPATLTSPPATLTSLPRH